MEKKNLLIVDDDLTLLNTVRSSLKDRYNVYIVSNGADALRFFQNKTADLVLLDVNMPEMNGYETLKRLKKQKNSAGVPVVFLSAGDDEAENRRGLELGAIDFIHKPVEMDALIERIDMHLSGEAPEPEKKGPFSIEDADRKELVNIATHDAMTGLLNKSAFRSETEKYISGKVYGAFMILDLDDFKYINDTFGHMEGDNVLISFARLLNESLRADSLIGRIGGDEFAVFIPGVTNRQLISKRAEEIVGRTSRALTTPDRSRVVCTSIGIAIYPEHGTVYEQIFNRADNAVLYVKNSGKNSHHIAETDDILQRTIKGRQAYTYTDIGTLLKKRKDEENQMWVKFGEFRLVWNIGIRMNNGCSPEFMSILFTVRNKAVLNMEPEDAELIQKIITEYFKEKQQKGVFAWYSINQMLMLLYDVSLAKTIVDNFCTAMSWMIEDKNVEVSVEFLSSSDEIEL